MEYNELRNSSIDISFGEHENFAGNKGRVGKRKEFGEYMNISQSCK
jgi:hypothetical protein